MMKLTPNPDPNAPKAERVNLPAGESSPKFTPKKDAMSQGFIANLKDFFTERPVKVSKGGDAAFVTEEFGTGFMDNLKDWFRSGPKAKAGAMASLRGANAPGIKIEYTPFYKSFFRNIRDLIAPPKQAPLQVTSKPVKVRDIWSKDEIFSRAQIVSFVAHAGVLLLVLIPILKVVSQDVKAKTNTTVLIPTDISPYTAKLPPGAKPAGGGGGGGDHEQIAASKGKLPKFSMQHQLAPPELIRNPNAKLMVTPTLIGPDSLKMPSPDMDRWGDPLGKMVTDSNGSGSGGGMGSGSGGGIGSGNGGGLGPGSGGGTGGGAFRAGENGYGSPVCVLCPKPEYSEEGRKARFMGTVYLDVTVLPNGRAGEIKLIKGLGMGLDEKAIETVKNQWTFKPAIGPNGKAVATIIQVEIQFQLY